MTQLSDAERARDLKSIIIAELSRQEGDPNVILSVGEPWQDNDVPAERIPVDGCLDLDAMASAMLAFAAVRDRPTQGGVVVTDAMRRAGGLAINPDADALAVTGHEAELAFRAMLPLASLQAGEAAPGGIRYDAAGQPTTDMPREGWGVPEAAPVVRDQYGNSAQGEFEAACLGISTTPAKPDQTAQGVPAVALTIEQVRDWYTQAHSMFVALHVDENERPTPSFMLEMEATLSTAPPSRGAGIVSVTSRDAIRTEIINTPETADFMAGVPIEAVHQRERWGSDHDTGKTPFDWFWLVGYLAQKAADAAVRGDVEKAQHHTISTAAALANWHAALDGRHTAMRPGIEPPQPTTNKKGERA